MRIAGLSPLFALSVAAHLALGAALSAIPARHHRETIAIAFHESKKPRPSAPAEPPREPDPPPPARTASLRAKSASPSKPAPVPATNTRVSSSTDASPDFGLSLSGSGAGGVAVPAGTPSGAAPPGPVAARTLSRSAPRGDDCADPPTKPKPLSLPSPSYTAEARAAGIAGKVRVEITVDEHGRVVSVRLLQGLGHGLDDAALTAARSMTFAPAVRCGRPSSATFKIGINFSPS